MANPKLIYEFGFGYHGTPLHYVSQHSALGICGNALVYYSLTGELNRHLMWGPGYGISTSAYHSSLDYVAYAGKDLKPLVHVYDCSTSSEVAQLSDVGELEITCLAFSVDGTRLATASNIPDCKLILWDIDKEKRTVTRLIEGQCDPCPQNMSFSPVSADRICVSSHGQLVLWTFYKSFHRTTFKCIELLAGNFMPKCHTWATHSDIIYVGCQDGELLSFNVKPHAPPKVATRPPKIERETRGGRRVVEQEDKKEVVEIKDKDIFPTWQLLITLDDPRKITHICARDGHLVVVGDGGHMRWVTVSKEPIEKKSKKEGGKKVKRKRKKRRDVEEVKFIVEDSEDMKSDTSNIEKESRVVCELALNVPRVVSLEYRSDGVQILVGASNGLIATVRVNQQIMELQLNSSSPDLLPTLTSMERGAEIEWESEFHDGAILAIGFLRGAKFMVTVGKDRTIRVWTSDRGKELSRVCLRASQTCLATSEKQNIVATGAANGIINVLQVDNIGRSVVIFYIKIHVGSLDQISFDGNEKYVVAASKEDGRFFFLLNKSLDFETLELLGYILMNNPILAHTWDIPAQGMSDLFVLLSLARGELVKLKVPLERPSGGGLVYDGPALRQISFRIPIPLNAIASGKYYLEKEEVERRVVWGFGSDKKLQQYRLPDNFSAWTGSEAMPHAAHFNIPGHLKPGLALVLGSFEGVLVTGGEDGAVQIRCQVFDPLQIPQKVLDVRLYDGFTGGITCMAVVNGRIYSGGATGVIFCCDTSGCGLRRGKQISLGDLPPQTKAVRITIETDDEEFVELSIVQKHEQNVESRYQLAGQPYRASLSAQIQAIKQEFQEIYEANEKAQALEKLSPKELLVDIDLEAQLRAELQKVVNDVVEKGRISDVKKDILVERIKNECYGSMADPEVILEPFCSGYEVHSFPLLKERGFNLKLAELAKQLRIIEMREMHYIKQLNKKIAKEAATLAAKQAAELEAKEVIKSAAIFKASFLEESSTSDAMAEGDLTSRSRDSNFEDLEFVDDVSSPAEARPPLVEPTRPTSQRGSAYMEDGVALVAQEESGDQTSGDGTGTVLNLTTGPTTFQTATDDDDDDVELQITENAPIQTFLYQPFDLTTSKRKRIQLQEIREAFNAKMALAKQNKIQIIQKIHEIIIRIKDLYRMLGGQGECPLQVLNESIQGMPNIFEVKNEEILVKKYLSKVERAKAEELRKAGEEIDRLRAGNDAAARALMDMMGGKLEKKVEIISIESEIQRPAWMSGNPKGFTKEQHKELKEFDLMLKQMKEEKEKKIRGQESEQRKLIADIQEMTNNFDKEILDMFNQRIQDEVKCIAIEESIARFSAQVEVEEFSNEKRETDLVKAMERLKATKAQSVSALTEFRREVDAFRDEYDLAMAEDKFQEKNFRKNFSDCGDQVNELFKAFQRRPMKAIELQPKEKKTPQTTPERRGSAKMQAPISRRGSLMGPPRKTIVPPAPIIDPFYEKPPEVTPAQWDRLVEARTRKMMQEEEVKKLTVVMNEMQGCLIDLTVSDDANRKQIEQALRDLAEFRESREKKRKNLIVPLHMKQGLVEAELKPLGGEYNNVSLLPRAIIVECNEIVLTEANSKIDMMKKMKAWKAENHLIRWEISRLRLQQQLVAEKMRHLQLLRVTKANQLVIKTGEDPSAASEALALVNRLEHNTKLQEKRKADKEFIFNQLLDKTEVLRKQNVELQETAAKLQSEFAFQNRVCNNSC